MAWLVAPGLALVAVTYGLARFAYGLFLPEMREALGLNASILGLIGAGSYAGYCAAIAVSLIFTARIGPRFMAVAAGGTAVAGMALVVVAQGAWVLALGILIAGSSAGLASPPMVEAVARAIDHQHRDRANTFINSGTSVGVALSGPVALLAAEQWRLAWAAFAVVGLIVSVWNLLVVPVCEPGSGKAASAGPSVTRSLQPTAKPARRNSPTLTLSWLVRRRTLPLLGASVGVGLASAAYWTFSRELVVQAGELSQIGSTVFWMVLGIFGLVGGAAGELVGRFGLGVAFRAVLLAMACSIGVLAVAPGVLSVAYPSAALFGASYIMLTGILLVWAVRVFEDRPSAGLGVAFLLIAAGQILGSYLAGLLAGMTDLPTTFLMFAGAALVTACVGPRAEDPGNSLDRAN